MTDLGLCETKKSHAGLLCGSIGMALVFNIGGFASIMLVSLRLFLVSCPLKQACDRSAKSVIVVLVAYVFSLKVEVFGVGVECGAIAFFCELLFVEVVVVVIIIVSEVLR